jgi:hypothetical protein
MFMRYGHFGIGHPVMMRTIIRDCLGPDSPSNTMDTVGDRNEVDVDYAENGDDEGWNGCGEDDDDDEMSDEEFSDEELERHGEDERERDHGLEGDEDEDDDDDLLSF